MASTSQTTQLRYDQNKARADRAERKRSREERSIDPKRYPTLVEFAKPLDYPVREIVGRDDERDQVLSNLCRPELSNVMLLAPPGSGKALHDDTMIPVAHGTGYLPIKDIEVGMFVFNEKGKSVKVTGVFPQGTKDAWRVDAQYGETVVCNDEHIWTVKDYATGRVITKTLAELDEMGMRLSDGKLRFAVSSADAVARPDEPYTRMETRAATFGEKVLKDFLADPMRVLRMRTPIRVACIDALTERFKLDPINVDEMLLTADDAEQATWIMRLLNSTGHAARLADKKRGAVIWAIRQPAWQTISWKKLDAQCSMTCIKVDSEDGLFLAGYSHMVTHNTALTQSVMLVDPDREYFEIDPAKLIKDLKNPNEMGARLKALFDEAEAYAVSEKQELVLFVDEFHQIVQMSQAAVEALKPVLADSGARGLRFIAATTFDEYNQWIRPNAPLDERLQRITLTPTDSEHTVEILRGMAVKYGVDDQFPDDGIFKQIVEITDRYQPSSVQPRKSIRVLDAMVGRYRYSGKPMDMNMLTSVIAASTGMNLAFNIDGRSLKQELDRRVFSQDMATTVVNRRLQMVVADLHDKTRPQGSFLFAGSTGVGKTELTKQIANLMFGDDRNRLIRFDMTEFAQMNSMETFRDELTSRVVNQGHAVVLLDEIEKAHRAVLRLMLQVLDDGRLADRNGRQVSFLNTYIVMTTNAGSSVFKDIAQYESSDTGDGKNLDDYLVLIESTIRDADFPPELLGRVDEIVPFQPLSLATQKDVVAKRLHEVRNEVKQKHNVTMAVSPKVLTYLTEDLATTDTDRGGARGAIRILNKEIVTAVAMFINEHPMIKKVQVDIEGALRADNKTMRKTQAHPVVKALEA